MCEFELDAFIAAGAIPDVSNNTLHVLYPPYTMNLEKQTKSKLKQLTDNSELKIGVFLRCCTKWFRFYFFRMNLEKMLKSKLSPI